MLVVGPSGAGKDALIDGARAALAGDGRYLFPRREITRPMEAGGEDHVAVSEAVFKARRAAGGYALSWRAHGLGYGVPTSVLDDLAAGRTVVANVSRTVLDEARRRFPQVRVACVSVERERLRKRLTARGRESPADIEERLARADAFTVEGHDVQMVRNDDDLASGVTRLLDVIAFAGRAG